MRSVKYQPLIVPEIYKKLSQSAVERFKMFSFSKEVGYSHFLHHCLCLFVRIFW